MAVTTKTPKAAQAAEPKNEVQAAPVEAAPVLLTLGLYQRYSRGGVLYEAGKVYGFTAEQADVLLFEEEDGRPIWRKYRPVKSADGATTREPEVVLHTEKELPVLHPVEVVNGRMEVGTDDELAELGLSGVPAEEAGAEGAAPADAGEAVAI